MIQPGEIYQHVKTGGLYKVEEIECYIQVNGHPDLERKKWVAYRSIHGGTLFFRQQDEFLDGRFRKEGTCIPSR